MKKLISLALALVLSLSLIACGAKQDDTPQTGTDTPDTTQTAEKQKLTGFIAEAWHIRYVGTEAAAIMTKNDWCLEEYVVHMGILQQ